MIPIRLDIDMQGRRLRDAFLWHKDESLCTPEIFAERLVCAHGFKRLCIVYIFQACILILSGDRQKG